MSDESGDAKKSRLESVIPGILKRGMEKAVEKTLDAPHDLKTFVGDLKLPKEIAHYIFSQVDETKNGLFRVVGHEVRDFLEHTNFAGEMQKILTTVQFEINTTIRFRPNPDKGERDKNERSAKGNESSPEADDSSPDASKSNRPEVKTNVTVRRERAEREERRRRRGSSEKNADASSKSDKDE